MKKIGFRSSVIYMGNMKGFKLKKRPYFVGIKK